MLVGLMLVILVTRRVQPETAGAPGAAAGGAG